MTEFWHVGGRRYCICIHSFGGELFRKKHLEVISVDRLMILIYTVKKEDGRVLIGFLWLRKGFMGGICECGKETFGVHKMLGMDWMKNFSSV